jgi:hypothetical protein
MSCTALPSTVVRTYVRTYLIEAFRGRMRLDTTESLHKVDLKRSIVIMRSVDSFIEGVFRLIVLSGGSHLD